jgi:hypothetical protein
MISDDLHAVFGEALANGRSDAADAACHQCHSCWGGHGWFTFY